MTTMANFQGLSEPGHPAGSATPRLDIKALLAAGAVAALLLAAPSAQATLIGDTVNCATTGPDHWVCNQASAGVGSGPEFKLSSLGTEVLNVDIGASSIRIGYTGSGDLGTGANERLILSDLDWVGMAGSSIGIANFATADTLRIEASDVAFSAHGVDMDFNSARFSPGAFLSFDLVTRHQAPEPASAVLVGLGMMALAIRRRRVTD